jgi:hypothetical protein
MREHSGHMCCPNARRGHALAVCEAARAGHVGDDHHLALEAVKGERLAWNMLRWGACTAGRRAIGRCTDGQLFCPCPRRHTAMRGGEDPLPHHCRTFERFGAEAVEARGCHHTHRTTGRARRLHEGGALGLDKRRLHCEFDRNAGCTVYRGRASAVCERIPRNLWCRRAADRFIGSFTPAVITSDLVSLDHSDIIYPRYWCISSRLLYSRTAVITLGRRAALCC